MVSKVLINLKNKFLAEEDGSVLLESVIVTAAFAFVIAMLTPVAKEGLSSMFNTEAQDFVFDGQRPNKLIEE